MISVIVPAVNEAECLGSVLEAARADGGPVEVLLVDGGSSDATVAIARAAGARVIESPVQLRATQMNLGAAAARGDVLLFLHADTLLPAGWRRAIATAFAREPDLVGGAFRRRFVPGSFFLRLTCAVADLRGQHWGWFLGDQAMFVRREIFRELGGFAPLRACEDLEFARRLARRGRVRQLREIVLTSDRRFRARGAVGQTLADLTTAWRFLREKDKANDAMLP